MLLNEFFTPSQTDLKLLALIVLGTNQRLKADDIKGNEQLIQSANRLINLELVVSVEDELILTQSGRSVSSLNGLADKAGTPSDNAYKLTNSPQ